MKGTDMFLIVAKWQDNSDSIFMVGNDPNNRKLPDWAEVFRKLDTIADPAVASVQYAKVSREFVLLRDEDTLQYKLDDPIACSHLRAMKLTKDANIQWYDSLLQSRDADVSSHQEDIEEDYETNEEDPEF